jgi:hypothetical protein
MIPLDQISVKATLVAFSALSRLTDYPSKNNLCLCPSIVKVAAVGVALLLFGVSRDTIITLPHYNLRMEEASTRRACRRTLNAGIKRKKDNSSNDLKRDLLELLEYRS